MPVSQDHDIAARVGSDEHLRHAPCISATWCGDEMVLLVATSGRYYTLNRTGGRMWELLATPRSANDLAGCLREEFAVEPGLQGATLQRDVVRMLDVMLEAGLLIASTSATAADVSTSSSRRAR